MKLTVLGSMGEAFDLLDGGLDAKTIVVCAYCTYSAIFCVKQEIVDQIIAKLPTAKLQPPNQWLSGLFTVYVERPKTEVLEALNAIVNPLKLLRVKVAYDRVTAWSFLESGEADVAIAAYPDWTFIDEQPAYTNVYCTSEEGARAVEALIPLASRRPTEGERPWINLLIELPGDEVVEQLKSMISAA